MGRRLAPGGEPEGTGELEIVEPVACPYQGREQPQSHQATPPVPVQRIPPGDDGVALLPRPEAFGSNGLAHGAPAPGRALGARFCLASCRLPTCHSDQSSSALAPPPLPYTVSGVSR